MKRSHRHIFLFVYLIVALFVACSSGSDSDGDTGSNGSDSFLQLTSMCGVQQDFSQRIVNPVESAERVSVQVLSSDAAIVTRQEGELAGQSQLVKFHGITSSGVQSLRIQNGIAILNQKLGGGAYFIPAGADCAYQFPDGGQGVLGQLFTIGGENVNELMLMQAAAVPIQSEICEGNVLGTCYFSVPIEERNPTELELELQDVLIGPRCGAVKEGSLINPITQAEFVSAEAVNTDTVIVTRKLGVEVGNQQLVKLHGLSSNGIIESRRLQGLDLINARANDGAFLVVQSLDCQIEFEGGGLGVVAQLYGSDGVSINEELLTSGFASATNDPCNGDLLFDCYLELETEAPPVPTPTPEPTIPPNNGGEGGGGGSLIDDFLWKPISEGDGNVVVLVNPFNVQVRVNGAISETFRDQGPSNGRGTTARGSAPGCSYGSNISVQFFDSAGQPFNLKSGGNAITIPNGCNRLEFRL